MDKLKSCPFCGENAVVVVDDETESLFGVKCFHCGGAIEPEKETLDEAKQAWNRRYNNEKSARQDNRIYGRHGHWDVLHRCGTNIRPFKGLRYACSICGHRIDVTDGYRVPNYCEECGSKNER